MRNVTADWEEINTTTCYALLKNLDSGRASWVGEDPSQSSAIEQADRDTLAQDPEIRNKEVQDEKKSRASNPSPPLQAGPGCAGDTQNLIFSDPPAKRGIGRASEAHGALRVRFDVIWNFK
ncbi:hypothetical protein BD779DRAFT_1808356 [Infundibulicybe gibba]|nr:hypothetical protein BD779DRAFT_1808356 [Infundibulicybe gibba]